MIHRCGDGIGKGKPPGFTQGTSEQGVDESGRLGGPAASCQVDRRVHGCRCRNPVHEQDLVQADSQDVQDRRGDFFQGTVGIGGHHGIQAQPPAQHPVNQLVEQGPVAAGEIRHQRCGFIENGVQRILAAVKAIEHDQDRGPGVGNGPAVSFYASIGGVGR
jgi:hypothetical protein